MLPGFLSEPDPSIYLSDNYCVLDLETTNKLFGDPRIEDNRLLLTVVKERKSACMYRWGNVYEIHDVIDYLYSFDFLVGHNIKFDLKWLAKAGLDLRKVLVYDTLIGEYVRYGNRRVELNLGATSVRYGGPSKMPYIDLCIKNGICPSELDKDLVLSRCALDVEQTELVFLQQREYLSSMNQLPVQYTRCILTPVLADIETKGMALDHEEVYKLHAAADTEFKALSLEMDEFTGGINPKSPKQVGEFLYDVLGFDELIHPRSRKPLRTEKGGRLTDSDSLGKLVPRTAKQRTFVTLKKRQSLLSAELDKALSKFKECCDNNHYLYAQFNQCNTQTHRLSSSGTEYKVQFQNLARKNKPLFVPKNDGWLMAEVDGAQLEFRVAAFLGQDETGNYDIDQGSDVHAFTASVITAAGQPTTRQDAKEHTFKPLFGGESGTNAEIAYYKAFREKYVGINSAQESWRDDVLKYKQLKTITGLRFFWPDTKITSTGYITNTTAIFNYPIQSLATADIIPIAVTHMWHRMKDMKSYLVNTVHDSIIAELCPYEVELFSRQAVKAFTEDTYEYLWQVYGIDFNTTLGVGIKIGPKWSVGNQEVMTALAASLGDLDGVKLDKTELKYDCKRKPK